jgi:hypothetical protein
VTSLRYGVCEDEVCNGNLSIDVSIAAAMPLQTGHRSLLAKCRADKLPDKTRQIAESTCKDPAFATGRSERVDEMLRRANELNLDITLNEAHRLCDRVTDIEGVFSQVIKKK